MADVKILDDHEIRRRSRIILVLAVLLAVFLILSIIFITLYAVEKNKSGIEETPTAQLSVKTCNSGSCVVNAADILNKLDESTNPCDDFYQYSCGGFLKKTWVPDGQNYVNAITTGTGLVQHSLREILQNEQLMSNYSEGSAVHKAFTFYKSCMNERSIRNAGVKPMLDVIEHYGSWNITKKHWSGDSWKLEKILARAIVDLETPAFLSLDVTPSYFNWSETVIGVRVGNSGYDERRLSKEQSRARLSEKHFEYEVQNVQ